MILQLLLVVFGIGGFVLVLIANGLFLGQGMSQAMKTGLKDPRGNNIDQYQIDKMRSLNIAKLCFISGASSLLLAMIFAMIVKHTS